MISYKEALSLATGLELNSNKQIHGFVIDSRFCKPGYIFFAIKGANVDGHDFAQDALQNGAELIVCEREIPDTPKDKCVIVDKIEDIVSKTLKLIIESSRLEHRIAITGSVGKTTTKYWLSQVLSSKHPTFFSDGNLNTIYGHLLGIQGLTESDRIGIFECGTSSPGEISQLSEIIKPNIAILLNVYDAHIGNYDSFDSLLQEKLSIAQHITQDGVVICDYELLNHLHGRKIITVGFDPNADITINANTISVFGQDICLSNAYHRHQMYIIGVICAVLHHIGDDVNEYINTLNILKPVSGRGDEIKAIVQGKNITVVNDSYNASPASMLSAIENSNCNVAVLGQMLALGYKEIEYHKTIAAHLGKFKQVYFVGDTELHELFMHNTNTQCYTEYSDELVNDVMSNLSDQDRILVKGSHATNVWKIVDVLNGVGD